MQKWTMPEPRASALGVLSGCTFETREITIAALEALGGAGIYNMAMVKEILEAFESEKKED